MIEARSVPTPKGAAAGGGPGGSGGFWIFARKSKKKPELYCSGGVVMVAFRTPLSRKGVLWSFLFSALGQVNSVQVRMTSTLGSTGQ
jgi:hypothetical protein